MPVLQSEALKTKLKHNTNFNENINNNQMYNILGVHLIDDMFNNYDPGRSSNNSFERFY